MTTLNDQQIDTVLREITREGVKSHHLRAEVLDHACCAIEEKMAKGHTFEQALQETLEAFGSRGLYKIDGQIRSYRRKKGLARRLRLSTASIAACLILLVLAVDAQERPSIKPLEEGRFRISSTFGYRMDPFLNEEKHHFGLDMVVPVGTPVKATADGTIEAIKDTKGYGKHVIMKHDDEYVTLYAQLSEFQVTEGQKVKKGDVIALSGNSGKSTGPHLHYEVIRNGKRVDPELYFSE